MGKASSPDLTEGAAAAIGGRLGDMGKVRCRIELGGPLASEICQRPISVRVHRGPPARTRGFAGRRNRFLKYCTLAQGTTASDEGEDLRMPSLIVPAAAGVMNLASVVVGAYSD